MAKSYRKEVKEFDDGKTTRKEVMSQADGVIFCNCKNPLPSFDEDGEYCDKCGKEI
jgi:hypothetical protein